MSQWDRFDLIVTSLLLLLLFIWGFPKGAKFYRYLFNLSVTVLLGVLYALPLVVIAFRPAVTASVWFTLGSMFFIMLLFVASVLFIQKRDRLYFWVIRHLR